ncbi:MAG: hypothetical protein ABOK23_09445 [Candidatus Methanoperedens sp.]|nr:hypothetical protein [Candidatus Methanoperedens sp.]MCZ7394353.1 hypothetical protein [Candidatus Methanoperedens sp.]
MKFNGSGRQSGTCGTSTNNIFLGYSKKLNLSPLIPSRLNIASFGARNGFIEFELEITG